MAQGKNPTMNQALEMSELYSRSELAPGQVLGSCGCFSLITFQCSQMQWQQEWKSSQRTVCSLLVLGAFLPSWACVRANGGPRMPGSGKAQPLHLQLHVESSFPVWITEGESMKDCSCSANTRVSDLSPSCILIKSDLDRTLHSQLQGHLAPGQSDPNSSKGGEEKEQAGFLAEEAAPVFRGSRSQNVGS